MCWFYWLLYKLPSLGLWMRHAVTGGPRVWNGQWEPHSAQQPLMAPKMPHIAVGCAMPPTTATSRKFGWTGMPGPLRMNCRLLLCHLVSFFDPHLVEGEGPGSQLGLYSVFSVSFIFQALSFLSSFLSHNRGESSGNFSEWVLTSATLPSGIQSVGCSKARLPAPLPSCGWSSTLLMHTFSDLHVGLLSQLWSGMKLPFYWIVLRGRIRRAACFTLGLIPRLQGL